MCFLFLFFSLFPSFFFIISAFSLYGEYVVRSFLPDGIFSTLRPRAGFFTTAYYVRIQSINQIVLLLLIHTFSVLSLQPKKLRRHNKSAIDLSNANPACSHKEVRRSTGHIMVTTRYSDQQRSKLRQKVMRFYKQLHLPIPKRFIKPPLLFVVSHIQRIGCQPQKNYFTRWPIPLVVC